MVKSPTSPYLQQWWQNKTDFQHADAVQIDATHNGSPFTVQLVRAVQLSGIDVAAGTNTPLGGVFVGLNVAPADQNSCCVGAGGTRTLADGSFSLSVAPGTYVLNVGGGPSPYLFRWYDGAGGTQDVMLATRLTVIGTDIGGLRLQATLGYRISGHVTTPGGAPAPQIGVHADNVSGNGGCPGGCGQTDNNGDFDFAIAPGTWIIQFDPQQSNRNLGTAYLVQYWNGSATVAGAATITATAGGGQTNMNVSLAAGFRISGRVTDVAAPASGIAGVDVNANDAATLPNQCCPAPVGGANTDSGGYYSFVVPAGTYKIFFNAGNTSYISRWYDGTSAGANDLSTATALVVTADATNISVSLQLGFVITGRVTDALTGNGIANVNVNTYDPTQHCCAGVGGGGTDQNGTYRIVLPAGSYRVAFQPRNGPSNAYLAQWYGGLSFETAAAVGGAAGAVATADAQLETGLLISGHVFGTAGARLSGVYVAAQPGGPGAQCCAPSLYSTNTDQTGAYYLAVAAGPYRVIAGAQPPYLAAYYSTTNPGTSDFYLASDVNGPASLIDITASTGHVVSGRLTSGGTGVANANVVAWRGSNFCCIGTRTGADGSYQLALPDGTYRMRFESPAGSHLVGVWYGGAATFDLASDVVVSGADVGPISATMTAGYWITGRVFRPDGVTPVADAFVNVQLSGGACCANTAWVTNTDASGVYHVAVPGGGSYIVQVEATTFPDVTPLSKLRTFCFGASRATARLLRNEAVDAPASRRR